MKDGQPALATTWLIEHNGIGLIHERVGPNLWMSTYLPAFTSIPTPIGVYVREQTNEQERDNRDSQLIANGLPSEPFQSSASYQSVVTFRLLYFHWFLTPKLLC